uniref:Uncharacterized protein n=1 Tax=Solanum lycopersicum TaxID=4081 RepID=A0A3Q7HYE7_SOLLC
MRGTSSTSLCFDKGKVTLQGFVDADLGGDVDSSKSTSGYIYTIGGTIKAGLEKCTSQPTPMAVSSSMNGADTPFAYITHFRSLIGAL